MRPPVARPEAELEAFLARMDRIIDRALQREAEHEFGTCTQCSGGVVRKRGKRWRCQSCGAVFGSNPSAPPEQAPIGHAKNKRGSNWNKHSKAHSSRTGQKKRRNREYEEMG